MRKAFVRAMMEYAAQDPSFILLTGDMGFSFFEEFESKYPGQFLNVGVAEAAMVSMAAGLALAGRKPLAYSIATFVTARAFEQIRLDLCYQRLPAVLVGGGGGFSYGTAGATHHATEDLSYLRALPELRLFTPVDARDAYLATMAALSSSETSPTYIRLGRNNETPLGDQDRRPFRPFMVFGPHSRIVLLSCGTIAGVVEAARLALQEQGIPARHITFSQIKPFPGEALAEIEDGADLICIEENTVIGGFGSAVAECIAGDPRGKRCHLLGVADRFHHRAHSRNSLLALEGIDREGIARRVRALMPDLGG